MKTHFLVTFFLLLNYFQVHSQAPKYVNSGKAIVYGIVINKHSLRSIEYANVALYRKTDSTMVSGTISDSTGRFSLTEIPKGDYYLIASFVGFKKKSISNILINSGNQRMDVGKIEIEQIENLVNDVSVTAIKNNIDYKLDKKIINVSQNINSTGGSAVDVLQSIPSIRVDNNGNVTLRGNTNFIVLINGKQSPLEGSDALRQIPANSIEKIELITNPSAKYDAEGGSGIINVILKKNKTSGFNGIVNASVGTGEKYSADFMFNYKKNGNNYYLGVDTRWNKISQTFDFYRTFYLNNSENFNNSFADVSYYRKPINIKFGGDFDFDKKNNLSVNVNTGKQKMERLFGFKNMYGTNFTSDAEYSSSIDNYNLSINFINPVIDFVHQFNSTNHKIAFEAGLVYQEGGFDQIRIENITDYRYSTNNSNLFHINGRNDMNRTDWRIKTDYTYKVSENNTIESGIQATFNQKNISLNYENFNYSLNRWEINDMLTYSFRFKNDIYAVYTTFSTKIFGLNIEAGIRAEETFRSLLLQKSSINYIYEKIDFFPTLHVSKELSQSTQIQFSYSKRITRPTEVWLNPYASHSDSHTIGCGNPDLRPQITNSYEFNLIKQFKNVMFSIETYYRQTFDLVVHGFYLNENGAQVNTFYNMDNEKIIGSEISTNIEINKILQINPVINLFEYRLTGKVRDYDYTNRSFSYEGRLNLNYLISPNTKLQINGTYDAASITQQGTFGRFYTVNLSVKQDFFKKNLSITLQCQDIFNSSTFNADEKSVNLTTHSIFKPEGRILILNLSYKINNYKKTNRNFNQIDSGT